MISFQTGKKYLFLLALFVCGSFFVGCKDSASTDEPITERSENKDLSYLDLEKLDRVNVSGNVLTIVLEEDQSLPYRWEYQVGGKGMELVRDDVVEEPECFDMYASVGSNPAYRVFQFECEEHTEAMFHAYSRHMYMDDEIDEIHVDIINAQGTLQATERN